MRCGPGWCADLGRFYTYARDLLFMKISRLFSLCFFALLLCRLFAEPNEALLRSFAVSGERMEQALARVSEHAGGTDGDGKVLVLGQVNQPGFYKPETLSLSGAITAAGGATRLAGLTHFYILRAGALTEYFAPWNKPPLKMILLQPGDVLFIEYQCTGFGASSLKESVKRRESD